MKPKIALPLLLIALSAPALAAGLAGHWEGAISVQGTELVIKVDFTESPAPAGTIDVPRQGALGIELANVVFDDPAVHFELPSGLGQAAFDGELAGDKIEGSFTQGATVATFHLERAAAGEEAAEEEYAGEQVTLTTPTGDLFGEFDLPDGDGPWPVALIQAGSGPTDRDGNSMLLPGKNNSLRMIGRGLAAHGIAALRVDKRGVAASASALASEADLRFDHYIDDAVAWLDLLAKDGRFGPRFVIGHSEGSLVGMAAAQKAGADAFVSVAGAGRPIDEVIADQLAGQPEEILADYRRVIAELRAGRTVADFNPALAAIFRPTVQPYMISWLAWDPAATLAELDMPVLIIQGDNDLQTALIEAETLAKARPRAVYKIIEGMNHILKAAPADRDGNLAAYSDPSLPLAPGFLDEIVRFLQTAVE